MKGDTYLRVLESHRKGQPWYRRFFIKPYTLARIDIAPGAKARFLRHVALRGDLLAFSKFIKLPLKGNEILACRLLRDARDEQAAAIRAERRTGLLKRSYDPLNPPGQLLRGALGRRIGKPPHVIS
jgi:hypothetical protein